MTKTTAEILREQMEKASDITSEVPRTVLKLKTAYLEEQRRINAPDFIGNRYMTSRKLERAAAEQFFQYLDESKSDYVSIANDAQMLARTVLVAKPKAPDALVLAEYRKALATLKTKAALKLDANALERELNSIVERFDNEYVTNDLYEQFHELSASVLSNHSDTATRLKLSNVYDQLEQAALNEDQRAANETIDFFEGAENRAMLSQYGPARDALKPILGDFYKYVDDTESGREHIARVAQEDTAKLEAVTMISNNTQSNLITGGAN